MGAILERTQHLRVFPGVANVPLRPPAMIAKTAASLDLLSGGRFELGLGAGAFWPAIEGLGTPRRSPAEAAASLVPSASFIPPSSLPDMHARIDAGWIDELTGLVIEGGMDTFVFGPAADAVHQVERFAAEVAPAVRESIGKEREQR
ncbi:hypothetical protein C2138_05435 [Salinibacterium hongtaonis]|nr:hypothetical protein C2138_05435 [Salinibacterium hongtaonis]